MWCNVVPPALHGIILCNGWRLPHLGGGGFSPLGCVGGGAVGAMVCLVTPSPGPPPEMGHSSRSWPIVRTQASPGSPPDQGCHPGPHQEKAQSTPRPIQAQWLIQTPRLRPWARAWPRMRPKPTTWPRLRPRSRGRGEGRPCGCIEGGGWAHVGRR